MKRQKIFVSFSRMDLKYVRCIFDRLKAQPVEIWDYSLEEQDIRGGENIFDCLKKQIDSSNVIIPLITCNSMSSKYTAEEVRYVLSIYLNNNKKIIPIADISSTSPDNWLEPYNKLSELKYYKINFNSRANLEECIFQICRDIGVKYLPLSHSDPKLPFMDKFYFEIENKCSQRTEKEIGIYSRLMNIAGEFQLTYQSGDYSNALLRINYLIATCEYEYSDKKFYYPYIVRAVCLISLGNLFEANQTLQELLNHHMIDENVYGALGYIKQQNGNFKEAYFLYKEALHRDPDDPAAQAGVLINALKSGISVDVKQFCNNIDENIIENKEDRIKIMALKATALASSGYPMEAVELFKLIISKNIVEASVIINYANTLIDLNKHSEAVTLLEKFYDQNNNDAKYLHTLASLCFALHDFSKSKKYFIELVAKNSANRQYRIDAAQVFLKTGDRDKAKEIVKSIFNRNVFKYASTENDFFYDGFANYLLENYERAEYDFERSGFDKSKYYNNFIL